MVNTHISRLNGLKQHNQPHPHQSSEIHGLVGGFSLNPGRLRANQNKMKKKLINIPTDLLDLIQKQADKNDRSVNKEIINILKNATL